MVELKLRGIQATQQQGIDVYYKGVCVGQYTADVFVEK
jgi:hypothetical protein